MILNYNFFVFYVVIFIIYFHTWSCCDLLGYLLWLEDLFLEYLYG